VKSPAEGGKYVAVDLKHIPEGGTCRMDKDATIFRVGRGRTPGTTQVRYAELHRLPNRGISPQRA